MWFTRTWRGPPRFGYRLLHFDARFKLSIGRPLLDLWFRCRCRSAGSHGGLQSGSVYKGILRDNAILAVVLASALGNIAPDQVFLLNQMSSGDGIHIFDSSDTNDGFEFSAVGDVDRDSVPDLLMSSKELGKEGFLIRGADLNDAIQSGELAFDLQPRFRNAASN